MKKYVCEACGWVYDEAAGAPDLGIAPGTKFADLPEDFACPSAAWAKTCLAKTDYPVPLPQGGAVRRYIL